jgi:hypothetical protein
MRTNKARYDHRIVGRIFSKGGRLHLVLEVDPEQGLAKVSCRTGSATEVVEVPVTEVLGRLGASNTLKLDRLSSDETEERVIEKGSRWFFQAREGEHGPFPNEQLASRALKSHILSAQEEGRTGRSAKTASC